MLNINDMEYTVFNNEKEMQWEIMLSGEKAYLSYRLDKENLVLMHTFVPEAMEGRGIAGALAIEAFKYAASHKKPVKVYCPFVAGYVKRHPEYAKQIVLNEV